jgi:hypothetical protein
MPVLRPAKALLSAPTAAAESLPEFLSTGATSAAGSPPTPPRLPGSALSAATPSITVILCNSHHFFSKQQKNNILEGIR